MSQEDFEFRPFPKIPRLYRECIVTEKIDGTNGQIFISDDMKTIKVGSRNRWLDYDNDNYGFWKWVNERQDQILQLGPGRHFGEFFGLGIQRNYGLKEKRFALFNTSRWNADNLPSCLDVVPVLYMGNFDTEQIKLVLQELKENGSRIAPGFRDPEGIMVFHVASGHYYKVTAINDQFHKGEI